MNIIPGESKLTRIFLTVLFCVIAISPLSPILLLLGWRRLKHIPEDDPNYRALRYVLIFGVIVVVLSGCYLIYMFTRTTEGENELNVRWLPPFATNVSYHRDLQNDAYEFDISEENFKLAVAEKYRVDLQEIPADQPVTVNRYAKYFDEKPESEHVATIKSGLYVDFELDKRKVHIVFDRTKERAYFCAEMFVK